MKKYISIVILFILILMQLSVLVQAAQPCSISLKPDSESLSKSDVLTVDVSMSNITLENGITNFYAILEYSKDKFEIVVDESQDAKDVLASLEDTEYEGCKILYIGQNDDDNEILNPWILLLIESEDGAGIIGIANEPQTESQKIAKIKFKVKDNVTSSNSETIVLEEFNIINETEEINIPNVSTTVKITASQSISITTPGNKNNTINTSTNKVNNNIASSTYNKTSTNTVINKNIAAPSNADEVPKAGTPIILPIILVFLGIIIFKYRKYNEYKDM